MGDWMEQSLEEKGFLVSGTAGFARRLSLHEKAHPSLRFVAEVPSGNLEAFNPIFLLIVENVLSEEAPRLYRELEKNPVYTELKRLFEPFCFHLLLTLESQRFPFFLEKPMTLEDLAHWFYGKARRLEKNPGAAKQTNRPESQRSSDLFRAFTRRYLSRLSVVNDIDAVKLQERAILLELKKPQESVDTWEPYIDDCPNYVYLSKIAERVGADLRIIAYNPERVGVVRLLLKATCDEPSRYARFVRYETALLELEEALGFLSPEQLSALEKRTSRRKRQR